MKETAKIKNILITACIPQNDTTITPYFIMAFTGKRKTMPEGIMKIPLRAVFLICWSNGYQK